MKKLYAILTFCALTASVFAQSYSDDFESYNVDDYMGVVNPEYWTTWSGTVGTSEDAQVDDAQAFSGTNSIYTHASLPAGGPQDALLIIGNNISTGVLTIGSQMYVTEGKTGYFNLQATPTPGTTWTLNFLAENGQIKVDEAGPALATATYTEGEWFEWEIVANMTFNIWKFYVNGELAGTFTSAANQVSTIDIFAAEDTDFWIDDIHFDWVELTVPNMNLSAMSLTNIGALSGLEYYPTATVRNNGLTEITSFDLVIENDGVAVTQNFSDVSLAAGEYMEIPSTEAIIPGAGAQNITLTVSNVNGQSADDYPGDDLYTYQGNFVQAAIGKHAVVEEGTGTWCQYCPRGAVTMARMTKVYGQAYSGIAVHNNDPMEVAMYDGGLGITGFPGGRVDRGAELPDAQFESKWIERMAVAPKAYVNVGAQFDEVTRLLQVVLEMECVEGAEGVYKPGLVVVEDSVTGTSSGYSQVNAFSGDDVDMGGFEDLPGLVPASIMVYNHVGRAILPDYNGAEDVLPNPIVAEDTYAVNFEMTIPEGWEVNQLHLVGLFYGPNRIDNSYSISLSEAITEGWYDTGTLITGIDRLPKPDATIKLYPNPASGMAYIDLGLKSADKVSVTILSIEGKVISSREYGVLSGMARLSIKTSNFAKGLYMVRIEIGNTQAVKKLIVD